MKDGKTSAERRADELGAIPGEELPVGEGTETLEIERPPVRIAFPGDVASARSASPRSSRPGSRAAAPGSPDSSAGLPLAPHPALRLMQVLPARARRSDR
jgi:hypothetical protein